MSPERTSEDPPSDDASFEAGMREQPELMIAMASREKWDGESRWVVEGRKLAGAALAVPAIVAVAVILWIGSTLYLGS